jgi:hypothetical protein
MKKLILISLFFGASNLFAQPQQNSVLDNRIRELVEQVNEQQKDIEEIFLELDKDYWTYRGVKIKTQEQIKRQKKTIDSLNSLVQNNSQTISTSTSLFGTEIEKVTTSTNSKISDLDSSLGKSRWYWIIATLATLLLGGLVYWLLSKRITSNKTDVETQIRNTKTSLEEESVKLDNKLVEVLTKQLDVIKADQATSPKASGNDHSLVLKVADRLTAMETNHFRMDPKTKGLKQLVRAVKSIKENYLASGYEIVEMMGQEYKEGLNVTANFIPSEEIETGKRVITRIIKPQVNFNGKMIQAAQIEVSVGE